MSLLYFGKTHYPYRFKFDYKCLHLHFCWAWNSVYILLSMLMWVHSHACVLLLSDRDFLRILPPFVGTLPRPHTSVSATVRCSQSLFVYSRFFFFMCGRKRSEGRYIRGGLHVWGRLSSDQPKYGSLIGIRSVSHVFICLHNFFFWDGFHLNPGVSWMFTTSSSAIPQSIIFTLSN